MPSDHELPPGLIRFNCDKCGEVTVVEARMLDWVGKNHLCLPSLPPGPLAAFEELVSVWRSAALDLRDDGAEDEASTVEFCADELDRVIQRFLRS